MKWFKGDTNEATTLENNTKVSGNMYRARTAFFNLLAVLAWDDGRVHPTTWKAPSWRELKKRFEPPAPPYPAMPEQNTYPNKRYLQQVIPSSRSVSRQAKEAAEWYITLLLCLCKQADTGEVNCPALHSHPLLEFQSCEKSTCSSHETNPMHHPGTEITSFRLWHQSVTMGMKRTFRTQHYRTAAGSISRACFSTAQTGPDFLSYSREKPSLRQKPVLEEKSHSDIVCVWGGRDGN